MENRNLERAAHRAKNDVSDAIDQLIATIEELEDGNKALKDKIEKLENTISEYEGRTEN